MNRDAAVRWDTTGSWTAVSSREMRENVEPVDAQAVLEAVVAMPVTTWNYKSQSDSIRHMGPMAQDFYAAFGLGVLNGFFEKIRPLKMNGRFSEFQLNQQFSVRAVHGNVL